MRLSKIAAGAAALVLSTALIAACGDKEEPTKSDATTSSSPKTDTSSSEKLTKDNFASVIGSAMQKAGSVHVSMTSAGSAALKVEGDQKMGASAADSQMSLTMDAGPTSMEMRMIDQKLYLKIDQLTQGKFGVVDLTDKSNPLVSQFGQLAEQTDLSKQFEDFGDAVTKFEKSGKSEKLDGVDAQAYDITLDAKKLAKAQGQDASSLPDSFTYTFYIGDDNLVRRMAIDIMGQKLQMDFTGWGKKVSIEKPKASEISDLDLSKLMSGAAAG